MRHLLVPNLRALHRGAYDGGGGAAPKVLAFLQRTGTDSNASDYTFVGVNVGTAAADRRNIITAHAQNGTAGVNNVTVGGDSWTEIQDGFNVSCVCALGIILNTSGTSEDVFVDFAGSHTSASIGMWESTGLPSDTPVDSTTSNASNPSASIGTSPGGFAVAAVTSQGGASFVWTNANEEYDASNDTHVSSGADAISTSGSSLTITATRTGGGRQIACFASF